MSDEKEKKEELASLISSITDEEKTKKDVLSLNSVHSLRLMGFIDAQIQKASSENELKSLVNQRLSSLIQNNPEDVGVSNLIHLMSVLNKSDNEFTLGLISTIKDLYQIQQEGLGFEEREAGVSLTADDLKNIKRFISLLDSIKDTEISEN